jgi:hypothetical protein
MLPAIAFCVFTSPQGRPISDIVSLGPATPISIGQSWDWKIGQVAEPVASDYFIGVGKHRRAVAPTQDFPQVAGVRRGADGSLLIVRESSSDFSTSEQDSVWYRGRERILPQTGVTVYRDRFNFAGSELADPNLPGPARQAPKSYAVTAGQTSMLGPGTVRSWIPNRLCVIEVPVDNGLVPAGNEFTTGVVTRLTGPFGHVSFARFRFVYTENNGTVILQSGSGSSQSGDGYVYFGKRAPQKTEVLVCRYGVVVRHLVLPNGWTIVGCSPKGWMLVRKEASPVDVSKLIHPGMPAGQVTDILNNADTGEEDWTMGVLDQATIRPIRFHRPKGTEVLLWRNGDEEFGPHAFRFHVFYGADDRWYRATPVAEAAH